MIEGAAPGGRGKRERSTEGVVRRHFSRGRGTGEWEGESIAEFRLAMVGMENNGEKRKRKREEKRRELMKQLLLLPQPHSA